MDCYGMMGMVVLENGVVDEGFVIVRDGVIEYVGDGAGVPMPERMLDYRGKIVGPGFVDIHCHAGGPHWIYEDAKKASDYHLEHGTTGLVCTLYRNLWYDKVATAVKQIKKQMKLSKNILGVHLEGPYLNPSLGCGMGEHMKPEPSEYMEIINSGIVRQWTFSPELEGMEQFVEDIKEAGIVPAIGHSAASFEQVVSACENGARIITHLTNATGSSISPTRYEGTIEVSFDHAALFCDNAYYEIICDKNGIHVRHDMIRLIAKLKGIDRIIGITDACAGVCDSFDINIENGEIAGSKMTMDMVARNFYRLGFSLCDVFKITALNPAKAIGEQERMGSLNAGKAANIVIADNDFNIESVILGGAAVL